ncbi:MULTISPECIES: MurR/RpiR family transcriptional regulator [Microbacterium]|uniref:MurR/RpiR family transcriptional regulator n=1 Tax=Microbacterium TaxID=33882 RepID=UPI000B8941BD|nr:MULTISPECIES: MurR/RpiR family transcriptional regulator [Microbacterium]MBT2495637.1 MurR/RpiR family transcriptional regulator [Microbacterium sp. ISL-59]NJI59450.1 MurR/RpiR family transcriptional regulator [Microbacterium sp. B19(2022)]
MATGSTPVTAEFGLRARLQGTVPTMSASMARTARLLLENPDLPISLSIFEFAERAGVSAPTVTRFCKFIGYSGYTGLRVGAAAELGRSVGEDSIVGEPGASAHPEMSDEDVLRTFLASHVQALRASADLVNLGDMRRVARMISDAPQVDVYGVGGSGTVAHSLVDRLYLVGVNARAWTDAHLGLMSGAILPEGAVAIGISSSGETSDTIEMLAEARASGAWTVAITSNPHTTIAEDVEVVIQTAPPNDYLDLGSLTSSHVQTFAADLLYLLASWNREEKKERNAAAAMNAISGRRLNSRSARPSPRAAEPSPPKS